jgi:PAS domain S-box-containing protein
MALIRIAKDLLKDGITIEKLQRFLADPSVRVHFNPITFAVLCTLGFMSFVVGRLLLDSTISPHFKPTKKLQIKDELIVTMLESQQERGAFVITDPDLPDNPIIYASEGFEKTTGYKNADIVGRNCRFLQGACTQKADIAMIRTAIEKQVDASICLLNYRKNGSTFINQFFISPLFGEDGKIAFYLGVQQEVRSLFPYPGKDKENFGYNFFRYMS